MTENNFNKTVDNGFALNCRSINLSNLYDIEGW